ncbi:unnamed protein product [Boreogadus saida]
MQRLLLSLATLCFGKGRGRPTVSPPAKTPAEQTRAFVLDHNQPSFHGTQEVQVSNLMPRLLFPASGDESLPVPWDFWMQPGPSFHGKLLEVPVLGREEGKLEGQTNNPRTCLVCELLVHSQCFMTDPPATTLLPLPHLTPPFFGTCARLEHGEREEDRGDKGRRTEETKGGGQRRRREEDRGDEGRRTEETKGGGQRRRREEDRGDEGRRTEETKGGGQRRRREEDRGDEGRRTEETKGN